MIDLRTFKALLSGLTSISEIVYQIWENNEMIFSTGGRISKELDQKECQNLSKRIIDQEDFQYRVLDGDNFLCGLPLRMNKGKLGTLLAYGRKPNRSSGYKADNDEEVRHGEKMGSILSNLTTLVTEKFMALDEAEELAQELDKAFEDLYLYGKLSTQIKSLTFSGNMLSNLLEQLLDNMRVEAAFAWLDDRVDFNSQVVKPHVYDEFPNPEIFFEKLIRSIPQESPLLQEGFFIINDSRENAQYDRLSISPYRFLSVKIQHQENFYGWLGLVSFNLNEIFRQGELKLLISLAEQLAGVIANTNLYKSLEEFIVKIVKSLVFAIEAKDMYTRGHSERVSRYSMFIGLRLGLSAQDHENLKWASILHDIGKIGIPEEILNKPDRLTTAEYDFIKAHPQKGADILQPIDHLADSLSSIIHHHERYDGKGYPHGLRGDEIPLNSRIIAVADTFDAINSTRAYRKTKSPHEAMAIIEEVSGSQLDPQIVEVFKKVFKEDLKL